MLKKFMKWLLGVVVLGGVVFGLGPREPVDETISFDAASIGDDVDSYLAEREAAVTDIKPGAQKQILWLDPVTKAKQPYALIYIHGFSASLQEIRPVPDIIGKDISANVYFTRLRGHGRNGAAMAEASVNDWYNDMAEAISIGRKIGEKVVILSTSTGGSISSWAATRPELMKDVVGMVMVSPNYGVRAEGSDALKLPWARQILPLVFGEERKWEPKNEQQGQWWSTRYPNVALLPMMASVTRANEVEFEEISVPALFIFHPDDGVVRSDITQQVAARWGKNTSVKSEVFEVTSSDDTHKHVIAGDILSPENTKPVAAKATAWIKAL